MAHGIQAGDKAPDFPLPSQAGEPVPAMAVEV